MIQATCYYNIATLGVLAEYGEWVDIGTETDRRPICLSEAASRQVECVYSEGQCPDYY
jgi:hypothetical protein